MEYRILNSTPALLNLVVAISGGLMLFYSIKFHLSSPAQLMEHFSVGFGNKPKIAYHAVSVFVFIIGYVAFLCCCSKIKLKPRMWLMGLLGVVAVLLTLGACSYWLFMKPDIESQLEARVNLVVKNTVQDCYGHDQKMTHLFDSIQKSLKCCGYHSPRSWTSSSFNLFRSSSNSTLLPKSCIDQENGDIPVEGEYVTCSLAGEPCPVYNDGCKKKITDEYLNYHHYMSLGLCVSLWAHAASVFVAIIIVRASESSSNVFRKNHNLC